MNEKYTRRYYSTRTGKNPNGIHLDLTTIRRLFRDFYLSLYQKEYFQEAFGYYCVDAGEVAGILGRDIEAQLLLRVRKANLWPIDEKCLEYSEDDLFDIIEFLFDSVSKPIDGNYHSYSGCGWHYSTFDQQIGQDEYRKGINSLLRDYQNGYELSEEGEILALAEDGLEDLLVADVPEYDPDNVETRISSAILKFRRYRSSEDDRRDAIRDLADVLEYLRPKMVNVLTRKDENDLFNIANNFGIRHHNESQKTDYDKSIWHNWMFYYYLSTIHAVLSLIKKVEENDY